MRLRKPEVWAWALYDWGNSAFATAVIAGFFPVFFKQFWSPGDDPTLSTVRLGLANTVTSVAVLILAPVLGAIADRGALKKKLLTAFAAVGITATATLSFVEMGQWQSAIVLYALGGIGFAGANIFYDALIVDVAERHELDLVSALGFALGYLGGGVLFGFCVLLTLWPQVFGLDDAGSAIRAAFGLVAIWWAVFTIPLLKRVREQPVRGSQSLRGAIRGGFEQLARTFHQVRSLRVVALFLAAYWLYIDGVDTVVRMAVDYGLGLGFRAQDLIISLLIVQFVGFPAALAFGWLGQRVGPKIGIFCGLSVYIGIVLWGYVMESVWEFYAIAVAIGLVQGGVQALSRSWYARLIPHEAAGEFFGFYNLLGKFAAVIGPSLMAWSAVLVGTRGSILSLLLLFAGGALLLLRIPVPDGAVSAGKVE